MTNAFYNHGTFPATGSSGSSSAMRAELDLIAAGFDLLPTLSGNAGKFVLVNSGASALTVSSALSETGGNVTVAGGLAVTGTVSGVGFSSYLASPPAIGGTAAAAGSFTTLSASSTVSGAGFSAYLASPPAIGGTAAAAGSFTTLALSSTATLNAGTANQVQYLNGSKQLAGSANLTFDGTTLTAAGLSGPHNGTVGATTPSTGSFTTVAVSSTLTLSAGTANQIGYLNASKQLVGSGNMTFNGFWIQLGGGVVGSQNAGVVANGSTTAAFRMVNASTGNTATDGVDIELNVLDLNIINREAGNITLHTSGTEQVRLDSSGNLGVGTSSPSYKLDVVGTAPTIRVYSNNSGAATSTVLIDAFDNTGTSDLSFSRAGLSVTQRIRAIHSGTASLQSLAFWTSGAETMRLDGSGNLGIGTSSPGSFGRLAVLSGSTSSTAFFDNTVASAYSGGSFFAGPAVTLRTGANATGNATGIRFASNANGSLETMFGVVQNASTYGDFVWQSFNGSYAERMRLDASGNLGLGVTPSGHSVSGFGGPMLQVGSRASLLGSSVYSSLTNNVYYSAGFYRYMATDTASVLEQSAGTFKFFTAPSGTAGNAITFTQAMTLDASGRLMVGNTSAQGPGVTATNAFYSLSSDNTSVGSLATFTGYTTVASYKANGAYLRFDTADSGGLVSEKMRLDASGNLGLGVTPSAWGAGFKVVEISPAGYLSIALASDINSGYQLNNAYYDTAWKYKNSKYAVRYDQDAAVGQHKWYNAPSGTAGNAITFTQAMTLDASGNLLVGTTSAIVGAAVGMRLVDTGSRMELGSAQSTNAYLGYSMYSTGAAAYRFYVGFGGTIFATSTTITAISDQRLKENIRDLDDGLGTVMALKPRKFDWKAGKGKDIKGDRGFIAQEFEQVLPDLIEEWKDPAPEGEEPYKAINANLIPTLVKAIQEQQALITDLRARVAALEPSGFEHFGIPKP